MVRVWAHLTLVPEPNEPVIPCMFISNDKVVYVESQSNWDNFQKLQWLVALNLQNGQELWRYKLPDDIGLINEDNLLDSTAERLFLIYDFRVNAFDLKSGTLLWSSKDLVGHTSYVFDHNFVDPLKISSTATRDDFLIDSESGEVLDHQIPPRLEHATLIEHDRVTFTTDIDKLQAVDQISKQILWEKVEPRPAVRQIHYWPIFIGDDMVYQVDAPVYQIRRVNVRTGKLVWETKQEYLSNITLSGDRLYAIHQNGNLVTLDVASGQMVGEMTFDKIPKHIGDVPFWVVSQGPYLLIFWGDEPELVLFRK